MRGEPLVAGGEEGLNRLMLSNAMHLSAFLDRPVALPIDEELYYDGLMKRIQASRHRAGVQCPRIRGVPTPERCVRTCRRVRSIWRRAT